MIKNHLPPFTKVLFPVAFALLLALAFYTLFFPSQLALQAQSIPDAVSDLRVAITVTPASVNNNQLLTYTIVVTNQGPDNATNVQVSSYLPRPYLQLLTCQSTNPQIVCLDDEAVTRTSIPVLRKGETATITVAARARSVLGDGANAASRVTVESNAHDSNLLDNSDTASVVFRYPFDLTIDQVLPAERSLFAAETFALQVRVQNEGPNPLFRTVQKHFTNFSRLVMTDTTQFNIAPALTYPSVITVGGVGTPVVGIEVSLYGMSRTWAEDMDVLLVGPTGVSVTLMSDVGSAGDLPGIDLTFSDAAQTDVPHVSTIYTGRYRPTNFYRPDELPTDHYPAPGPGEVIDLAPYLGRFAGVDANGVWKLYIVDDQPRDTGVLLGGWGITIATFATSPLPIDVAISLPPAFAVHPVASDGWSTQVDETGKLHATLDAAGASLVPLVISMTSSITPGTYLAEAEVKMLAGEARSTNNRSVLSIPIESYHDLSLSGTVTPSEVQGGDLLTFTLVATNSGPNMAQNVELRIALPADLQVNSTQINQGTCGNEGEKLTCGVQFLQAGGGDNSTILQFSARVQPIDLTATHELRVDATVSNRGDFDLSNNTLVLTSTLVSPPLHRVYLPIVKRQ